MKHPLVRSFIAVALAAATVGATATPVQASAAGDSGESRPESSVRVVAAADDEVRVAAVARVAEMSLREKAGSVVMGHIPTTDAARLADYMAADALGGFILMGSNVPASESKLRTVTDALGSAAALPPLIAIDQEGGDVSRLPWDDFPSSLTLKQQPPTDTADAFAGRSALVLRGGINVNFGIVADETDDPDMFIYRRALGTTPDGSADRVSAAVRGEAGTVASTLKHFPGHGAAPGDSHRGLPRTGMSFSAWQRADGLPFGAGIAAGAPLLMFGHLRYTDVDTLPATMSPEWHRIAREELGFAGVSITDDLGMLEASGLSRYQNTVKNAVDALRAGNDMVLTVLYSNEETAGRIVDGIVAAVEEGRLDAARLEEAAERVMALRLELSAGGTGLMPCGDCDAVQ